MRREHPSQHGYEPFSIQDTEPVSPSTTKSPFSPELLALRQYIEKELGIPDTDLDSLLSSIAQLYQARKTELKSNYLHEVRDELDGMAICVAGITAREAAAARSKTRFHEPVPDEIAPIFSRQVVSGGLPTLGRGRR